MDDDERKDKTQSTVSTIKCLELSVLFFIVFLFFLLYPSSVLVCLCFPDKDILLSNLLIVSCLFIRRRPLVSTFS